MQRPGFRCPLSVLLGSHLFCHCIHNHNHNHNHNMHFIPCSAIYVGWDIRKCTALHYQPRMLLIRVHGLFNFLSWLAPKWWHCQGYVNMSFLALLSRPGWSGSLRAPHHSHVTPQHQNVAHTMQRRSCNIATQIIALMDPIDYWDYFPIPFNCCSSFYVWQQANHHESHPIISPAQSSEIR